MYTLKRILNNSLIWIFIDIFTVGLAVIIHWWSANRFFPLIDYSYNIEAAYQIYSGRVPYRDFFLVLPPGMYLLMAFVMKLVGGYTHLSQMYIPYITTALSVGFVLYTLRFIIRLSGLWPTLLILPVIFRGHAYYPTTSYDMLAMTSVLVSLTLLLHIITKRSTSFSLYIACGISVCFPLLFKQNIGFLFLSSIIPCFTLSIILSHGKRAGKILLPFYFSIVGTCIFLLYLFVFSQTVYPMFYQLFTYPASVRNLAAVIDVMKQEYLRGLSEIFPTYFYVIGIGITLILFHKRFQKKAVIFLITSLFTLYFIFQYVLKLNPDINEYVLIIRFWAVMSIVILFSFVWVAIIEKKLRDIAICLIIPASFSILSTFLSYGIAASSYSAWMVSALLLGFFIILIKKYFPIYALFILVALPICYMTYTFYSSLQSYGFHRNVYHTNYSIQTATTSKLYGITLPGTYVSAMEQMFQTVKSIIPKEETVVLIPGEIPFYAVTERRNPLPYIQYHLHTSGLNSNEALIEKLKETSVKWLVINTNTQHISGLGFIFLEKNPELLYQYYMLYTEIPGYRIYTMK